MVLTKKQDGSQLVIAVEGRLDTKTSPQLDEVLQSSLNGVDSLIIDCGKLEYISSAGLRVLLGAHKKLYNKGQMKVINTNELVKEVFDVTGLSAILFVE